ncbi:hypothetical protein HGM15179_004148 [Zosterops borbonicus]|uniref:Fork-head domain-containing protein n=1 Tax=Zosterops borbonicus TaxID=364589 RepID=A0A8K1GRD0_9PASS|nr:hypothetical protein HGM15179_004148 [Zosterops borbonicus]
MAEASPPAPLSPLDVELDPEFEPQSRPRSCTWPLQRPELQASPAKPAGEPAADAASMIPEEEDDEEEGAGSAMTVGSAAPAGGEAAAAPAAVPEEAARLPAPLPGGGPEGPGLSPGAAAAGGGGPSGGPAAAPRKCSSRRNAWGNLSYADLITRAIESSPEKRLTLSQIYDWMVRCVPYFKDKGDSNSSAGWKRLLDAEMSAAAGGGGPSGGPAAAPRKCSSRRNAWGNLSYADLITRAIESSPEKRLTLSQIYDWMVRCVPYFKDKGDSNSSAGWKGIKAEVNISDVVRKAFIMFPVIRHYLVKQSFLHGEYTRGTIFLFVKRDSEESAEGLVKCRHKHITLVNAFSCKESQALMNSTFYVDGKLPVNDDVVLVDSISAR